MPLFIGDFGCEAGIAWSNARHRPIPSARQTKRYGRASVDPSPVEDAGSTFILTQLGAYHFLRRSYRLLRVAKSD